MYICPPACLQVLLLGSIPAEQFFGDGDASQEAMLFRLHTDAQRAQRAAPAAPVPLLPTGNIVSGLPAALLAHYQVRACACMGSHATRLELRPSP